MRIKLKILYLLLIVGPGSLAQKLPNGDFSYTCYQSGSNSVIFYDVFYNSANCGLDPWKISHGSPDIQRVLPHYESVPFKFYAGVHGGKDFGVSPSGSEGIFQNYNFFKGNRYYLRAFVKGYHVNDGGNNDIDKVFVALTNGLTDRSSIPEQSRGFSLPQNGRQDVWYEDNFKSDWKLIEKEFVANADFSQLWISLKDNDGDNAAHEDAEFFIGGIYISCSPYDQSFVNFLQSPILHLPANVTAGDKIETTGLLKVGAGENVTLQAGKEIGLATGFVVTDGGLFTAQINDYCDCSVGGGIVQNICNVFNGGIQYIPNSQGPGVYVPTYFNRDMYTNWYPSSYGYTKPYNAYYWNLKIFDRWGLSVYESNGTSGVDGFADKSITWNGGNVSSGTYYVQLDLTNCSGTYTYNSWLQVDGAAHPNSSSIVSDTKSIPSLRVASNSEAKKVKEVEKTMLYDIYPNPSSRLITFKFSIASPGHVNLVIYDELGAVKKVMISEDNFPSGLFEFAYSVESLFEGVYICSLQTRDCHETKKMVVVK